jgi:hypothetical protein
LISQVNLASNGLVTESVRIQIQLRAWFHALELPPAFNGKVETEIERLEKIVSQAYRLSTFQAGKQLESRDSVALMMYDQGQLLGLSANPGQSRMLHRWDLRAWSRDDSSLPSALETSSPMAEIKRDSDLMHLRHIEISERAVIMTRQVESVVWLLCTKGS